ncbi:MAG: DegT/DnrJ/EryC1/StrS family aminotransferase, partial [bacterium]|nr:DegT/DnrJ/EryC1/StrS family aminotransferase [bacterium]
RGRHAGTMGDVGCFSFYPVKHMTTGEGGMVTTNDAALADRIRRQRAFGLDRTVNARAIPGNYDVTMLGYNYRMNEMAAALGIVQLGRVPDFLAARRRNDAALRVGLGTEERITLLPPGDDVFEHSRYCAVAILRDDSATQRFEIVQYLKAHGVGTSVYYPKPVPHLAYYRAKYGYDEASFPVAARISGHGIALPVGQHLTEEDMVYVATTVRDALNACTPRPIAISFSAPASAETAIPLAGRRIALIGGAGFIGHHLALELRQQGAQVTVIDSLQVNNLLAIAADGAAAHRPLYTRMLNERLDLLRDAQIPLHVQDARDYHAMCRLLATFEPQVVVQLAAVAHANRSNKDPHTTFDHSLRTLENVLDYARVNFARGQFEHFVYFSSSMVYGNFPDGFATEETPCNPLGIYGALKRAGELIVESYHQVFGLPYTIVRPSALYGERCVSRRVGQIFIENAIAGRDIIVQGDGSDALDFTCVHDLVHGISRVLVHPD